MSIATESYITLNDTDKIGLSDTLDNYSIDDIKASGYVGAYDPLRYNCYTAKPGVTMWDDGGLKDMDTPFHTEYIGYPYPEFRRWTAGTGAYTGQVFSAVVWLERQNQGLPSTVINASNISDYKIVTEMPANKMYYTVPNLNNWDRNATTPISATSWSDEKTFPSSYYAPLWGTLTYHSNYGHTGDISADVDYVYPYMMYEYDGYFYFQLINMDKEYYAFNMTRNASDANTIPFGSSAMSPYDEATGISLGTVYNVAYQASGVSDDSMVNYFGANGIPFDWGGPANEQIWIHGLYDSNDPKVVMYLRHGGYGTWYYHLAYYSLLARKEDSLLFFANGGVKIIADKPYKPIIVDGVVTGITDDMTEPSELDDWDMGSTDHGISPAGPPAPPTPLNPWDVDAETYGWGGNEVGGMVRYYLLTSAEMDSLVSAMGSSANWVIDYLNNIVSCFIVPNNGLFFDAPVPTTVKFRVDNNTEWDTGVSCKRISGVVNKSGGTIEIPRCTKTFLDFEPYSDYSIYIPFCGRVPIKGNIVCGREVTVTYYPDVPTCSLTAVVTCGGSTIAIAKGQYGSMIPVTSSGADRKTAAAISDVSSIITGIGVGIAGAATGNAGLLIAGGSQLVGGFLNAAKDSVQSYAYSSGSSGDTSFFAAGTRCQYYANYLQLDDVVNTSEFGHTIGYLCKEIGKLSSYHGFTICANPHVHISATSTEKEEIKQLLEQGVILP